MLGVVWVPRDSLFASACRGKSKFRALWECSRWPFHLACRGKANFRVAHEAQERPVGRNLGPLRLPFPSACRGKGNCRALWECSRWLFPPACRGKGAFRAPPGCPRAALYGCWAQALIPRGCIFPLPVEETSRSRLPGNAHDCLFPLPVEENVISGLPCEGKEWACSDGSGCQPAFAPSDSPSSSKQIRAA